MHCEHRCEEPCHPGEPCKDEPCRVKIKASCPCGIVVQEKACGAFSGKTKSMAGTTGALKCTAVCESSRAPRTKPVPVSKDPEVYATDLYGLATAHKKYVPVLEDLFFSALSNGNRVVLPACDTSRRLLAVEYARMHWKLKTKTQRDTVEGWHIVHIEPAQSSRMPRPTLTELAAAGGSTNGSLKPALSSQPILRFCGVKGFGDELYELVGFDGLLGVRPGQEHGEVLAFIERGSMAVNIFKKLTGKEPGQLEAVRGVAGSAGLSVSLEQTFACGGAGPRSQPASSSRAGGSNGTAWGAWGAGAKAKASAPSAATKPAAASSKPKPPAEVVAKAVEPEPVLDSWEDL